MPFQIEFPDGVDLKAGMLTITLEDTGKTIRHNVTIQSAALTQKVEAQAREITALEQHNQEAQAQLQQRDALIANLKMQLVAALKDKPPAVDVPPVIEPPVVDPKPPQKLQTVTL